jgi:hypothetical protein
MSVALTSTVVTITMATAVAAVPDPAEATERAWYWEWSDGSRARERLLAESRYTRWSDLPGLRVASDPPAAGRTVLLQVMRDGRWFTEDSARTAADGRALLSLNPYCEDGAWCTGLDAYRLVAGDATARLTVRFTPAAASP